MASLQGGELGDADTDGNPLTESLWNEDERYPDDTSPVGWRVLERVSEAEASMLRHMLSARDLIVDGNGESLLDVSIAKVLVHFASAARSANFSSWLLRTAGLLLIAFYRLSPAGASVPAKSCHTYCFEFQTVVACDVLSKLCERQPGQCTQAVATCRLCHNIAYYTWLTNMSQNCNLDPMPCGIR